MIGEKMTKAQWRRVDENKKFSTYSQWEEYVRKRYKNRDKHYLKSFAKYLAYRESTFAAVCGFSHPLFVALFSMLTTVFVQCSINASNIIDSLKNRNLNTMLFCMLVYVLIIIIGFGLILREMYTNVSYMSVEKNFLCNYKEIIENLL